MCVESSQTDFRDKGHGVHPETFATIFQERYRQPESGIFDTGIRFCVDAEANRVEDTAAV
jgi:hypothetical protein